MSRNNNNNNKVVAHPESITADQAIAIIESVAKNGTRSVPVHTDKEICGRRTVAAVCSVVCCAPCIISSVFWRLALCSASVEVPSDACLRPYCDLCVVKTMNVSVVKGATWKNEDLDRVRSYASSIMNELLLNKKHLAVYEVFDTVKSLADGNVGSPTEFIAKYFIAK